LKRKNLKQKDLAAMMGVQSSAVSQWVTGKTQVDPKNLPQLAHVLGVTVDALLAGSHHEVTNGESGIFTTGNIASVRPHIKEFYTLVPFLTARAQAGIPLMSYENFTTDLIEETYPVFLPVIAINERHLAIEISGDSMEPSIIERAVVLVEAIAKGDIKYESGGVYAVLYGTGRFVVKRVKTNDINTNGTLTLWSDNERYGHIVVQGDEIRRMWKVIEKVREPVR
jgi:phage repressor protein C with HTH and peptisase S24 domain